MADKEGLRRTDEAIVVNVLPDVCLTPFGPIHVPVPYNILARLGISVFTNATVRMNGLECFVLSSRVPRVVGDEPGTGGGIISGVNLGYCRPITHSPTVRAGGELVVYHSAEFWMNCNGPEGVGNTKGRAVFIRSYNLWEIAHENPSLDDGFPYSPGVFEKIEKMNRWINEYAQRYGVPPGAVAGAIADEYNTISTIDWMQDALIGNLPNSFIEGDLVHYHDSKLRNAFKNDLGPGNIKLETAWRLYQNHPDSFPTGWNFTDMVDYIQSDQGTAHVAALYIHDAQTQLGPLIQNLPSEMQEAVLVTAYKRGIEKYEPSLRRALTDETFRPGEGIRYLLQRAQILRSLSRGTQSSTSDGVRVCS